MIASDDYFRAMNIPLVAGRFFDETDRFGDNESKVIVNQGPPTLGVGWRDGGSLEQLRSGRGPSAPDEVAINASLAKRGNFQLELFVYGREGEPCKICGTRLTGTHDIDARITVFCHRCQR